MYIFIQSTTLSCQDNEVQLSIKAMLNLTVSVKISLTLYSKIGKRWIGRIQKPCFVNAYDRYL